MKPLTFGIGSPSLGGNLAEFFKPSLTPTERKVAEIEGWILGLK